MGDAARPWYASAFEKDYLTVYPHRDLESARREAGYLVRGGLTGRVLDLCCGFGRHSLALRRAGADVFGLDLSLDLLARAAELDEEREVAGRLVRGDARFLPFRPGSVDSVVMLFSSFGYFDDGGNAALLDEIARVLAVGGTAVFDLMNARRIRESLVPESRTERDGLVLVERRRIEEWGRRVVKEVHLRRPDGTEREWREDVRLYGTEELRALLGARGMTVERVDGDFDGGEPSPDSPRRIVWARRR